MTIQQYFDRINQRFQRGISTEHSYRGELQSLLEKIATNADITNEPTRIACGSPDFILTKKGNVNFPIGYIEAKDILDNLKLENVENTEQLVRYRSSLNNLILTNYIEFRLYINGKKVTDISIAKIDGARLIPIAENWPAFENLIKDFSQFSGISIKSAPKLAEMMASKARLMQQVLQNVVESDEENQANSSLKDQMHAFKNILIHDISPAEFADIYAQTIAYGLFAARLHDTTLSTFTRQEAVELIPKSNPFLRKLFGYIAGLDIDDRIIWIVDALAEVFRATDVSIILKNFGKLTKMEDPIIHFYETFLAFYNPKLRKSRGVWYTPEPVVNFIVRAVDEVLINEFYLPLGLGDFSKTTIKKPYATKASPDQRSKIKTIEVDEVVHKIQILDPATGTGTFLAEVIKQIYLKFEGQEGIWSQYTEDHLIPRLHGFELLMASYAMAHLKLDLLLKQTGYVPTKKENRLRIYLTNSLEEAHADSNTLFASWLSQEASEANNVKRYTPVMVVIGNPPYSVSSSNKGEWIQDLISDYKKDLNEKKLNLDDDYIKFIRYAQYLVDKNGKGIVAMITNNTFIDAVTCRQMRKSLYSSFDKIYIYDLHGSSKKNEVSPDGTKDENVFDIQQGVSISIFVKKGDGQVHDKEIFHFDSYGKRAKKYELLKENSISTTNWQPLKVYSPYYFFVPKDFKDHTSYDEGFKIDSFFNVYNSGIKTDRDDLLVDFDYDALSDRIKLLLSGNYNSTFKEKFRIVNSSSYKIIDKIRMRSFDASYIKKIQYRILDYRYIYYDSKIISRPAEKIITQIGQHQNLLLITCRQQSSFDFQHAFLSDCLIDICTLSLQTKETGYGFPVYIYNNDSLGLTEKFQPNFNLSIVQKITEGIGGTFSIPDQPFISGSNNLITPIDIFDYVYAILNSPVYRMKYKEFLKIDFPKIPYPKNLETFRALSHLGKSLRNTHLLDSNNNRQGVKYPISGTNIIDKPRFESDKTNSATGKVFINDRQYFDLVPKIAWDFFVGGYQPAQKWLKDRKNRTLNLDDITSYQKIIIALSESYMLMEKIAEINFE